MKLNEMLFIAFFVIMAIGVVMTGVKIFMWLFGLGD